MCLILQARHKLKQELEPETTEKSCLLVHAQTYTLIALLYSSRDTHQKMMLPTVTWTIQINQGNPQTCSRSI